MNFVLYSSRPAISIAEKARYGFAVGSGISLRCDAPSRLIRKEYVLMPSDYVLNMRALPALQTGTKRLYELVDALQRH